MYYSKAIRVSEQLAEDLFCNRHGGSGFLPAETVLAQHYAVSRLTMRRALEILEGSGMLQREPVRGHRRIVNAAATPEKDSAAPRRPTIAIAWFGWEGPFLLGIRGGIREYADANDFNIRFFSHNYSHDAIIRFFNEAERHDVAGIITLPYDDPTYETSLGRLQRNGFPLVCVDRGLQKVELNTVTSDNIGGAYEATRRLLERRKLPVWFFGQAREVASSRERYHGYVQAMSEAGFATLAATQLIESHNLNDDPTHWPREVHGEIIRHFLLAKRDYPISVFCCNEPCSKALYDEAARCGLTIGHDIYTIGFDELPTAATMQPPLTTFKQPLRDIGFEAAALLHKLIRREIAGPVQLTLPVHLTARESD